MSNLRSTQKCCVVACSELCCYKPLLHPPYLTQVTILMNIKFTWQCDLKFFVLKKRDTNIHPFCMEGILPLFISVALYSLCTHMQCMQKVQISAIA